MNDSNNRFIVRILGALIPFGAGLLLIIAQGNIPIRGAAGWGAIAMLIAGLPFAVVVFLFFYTIFDPDKAQEDQKLALGMLLGIPAGLIIVGFLSLMMSVNHFLGAACFISFGFSGGVFVWMMRYFNVVWSNRGQTDFSSKCTCLVFRH